jgi:hypothetical protein
VRCIPFQVRLLFGAIVESLVPVRPQGTAFVHLRSPRPFANKKKKKKKRKKKENRSTMVS